jgi:uncharacterized membrane protein YgcG
VKSWTFAALRLIDFGRVTMTETHSDMSKFFGGAALRTEYRTNEDLAKQLALISKTARRSLSPEKLAKVRADATTGLSVPFTMMSTHGIDFTDPSSITPEQMIVFYNVEIRLAELRGKMSRNDIHDCMETIPTHQIFDETDLMYKPASGSGMVNLWDSYSDVSFETILRHSKFGMHMAGESYAENLAWTYELILNSCDSELRAKILETTSRLHMDEQTGPVAFKVMTNHILSVTQFGTEALQKVLERISVQDFPAENVSSYVSVARAILVQLENGKAVPVHALKYVANGLMKCSTERFVDMIKFLFLQHQTGVRSISYSDLLRRAEAEYQSCLTEWVAKTTDAQDSAFYGGCFNCGAPDHYKRDCPKPIVEGQGGRGGGRGTGRGRGGRGRGGGRRGGRGGERGGRGGRGRGEEPDPLKQPPKKGEPHEQTLNGKKVHWCGRCARWCDHATDKHGGDGEQANSANTPPGTTSGAGSNGTTTETHLAGAALGGFAWVNGGMHF